MVHGSWSGSGGDDCSISYLFSHWRKEKGRGRTRGTEGCENSKSQGIENGGQGIVPLVSVLSSSLFCFGRVSILLLLLLPVLLISCTVGPPQTALLTRPSNLSS